jgi:aspartyl-tRNA(Asn)/glutamyl-tRNA(Gln) amidotransferase subunit B
MRLKTTLQYVDVSDCNMEEGSLRCDANVSLRERGGSFPDYKVEIKNLNSFRNVQHALEYEIDRQRKLIESGEKIPLETRLYDADRGVTISMRSKEEAHDYRYFPEPDLLPLEVSEEQIEAIRAKLPELPGEKTKRIESEYQIPGYDAAILASSMPLAHYFEECARVSGNAKAASNWIMTEVLRELKARNIEITSFAVSAETLAQLLKRIDDGTITGKAAKDVFAHACETGRADIDAIIKEKGLTQIHDDSAIEAVIAQVIAANPKPAEQYRAGKTTTLGFLVGQVMKATSGRANPQKAGELLKKALAP